MTIFLALSKELVAILVPKLQRLIMINPYSYFKNSSKIIRLDIPICEILVSA